MKNKTRYVTTAGGALVVAGALLAGSAGAASAAPVASNAVATSATNAELRAENLRLYGVAVLPVPVTDINKYKLSRSDLRGIAAGQKLAKTPKAKQVRQRESHGNYRINTGNGYYGAYQFDRGTWVSNGGKRFGKTANAAPAWAQDYVMYRTHQARGWSPWGG